MINKIIKDLKKEIEEIRKAKEKLGKQPYMLKSLTGLSNKEKREVMEWCKEEVKISKGLKEKGIGLYNTDELKAKLQAYEDAQRIYNNKVEKLKEVAYMHKEDLLKEINKIFGSFPNHSLTKEGSKDTAVSEKSLKAFGDNYAKEKKGCGKGTARRCLNFKGFYCDNEDCLNEDCPLNKEVRG